ncbi:aminotransferase class IV [Candidatus Acidulodesulfobacterium sp. H_13]|uniref:aminotransferase class IV n=1 Tax=Candidatus Acidulodesulfobacterium sp. H_13 TaxID=3395470 RepID=UPI003AF8CAA9
MPHFIDTIKLSDGNYKLIDYHNRRVNDTIRHFFGAGFEINIETIIPSPDEYKIGIYKCRLVYAKCVDNIQIIPYVKRTITKLKIIDSDDIHLPSGCKPLNYEFKYKDRTCINYFLSGLDDTTDVLITRNGLITDTSFSNVILFDGQKWITPDTCLLNGIKRRYLLDKGDIEEKKISTVDLPYFQKISLINAMLEPKDIEINTSDII